MTVLQVVSDTDRRGAQVFAVELADELARQGRVLTTVALAPGRDGGLEVPILGDTAMSASTLRALRAAMRDADVVVAHGSTTLPACAIAGIGTRTPFVYRQISDSRFWANTTARRMRVRIGLARAAHVVALWSGSKSVLVHDFGVSATKITIIPNAVAADRFMPGDDADARKRLDAFGLSADRFTATYVGALAMEKGVDVAIRAVADLPGVQLVVVGDGPDRAELEALARPCADRIAFAGSVSDVRSLYLAADVVLLPSRSESMPATLIEAGMVGRPAIATAVGAIPDIVIDGRTGYLVPVGDAPALREAIARLAADPALAGELGRAASEHCRQEYSLDRISGEWAAVLDSVRGDARAR